MFNFSPELPAPIVMYLAYAIHIVWKIWCCFALLGN